MNDLRTLAEDTLAITGEWYDAGCNTVQYYKDHDVIANPCPLGIIDYIVAVSPEKIIALLDDLEVAQKDAVRWRYWSNLYFFSETQLQHLDAAIAKEQSQ